MSDERYRVVYEQAIRRFEVHERRVDSQRARAGQILAGAAFTGVLTAVLPESKVENPLLSYVAMSFFLLAMVISVWEIGWSIRNFPVAADPEVLLDAWIGENEVTLETLQAELARRMKASADAASRSLTRRDLGLRFAAGSLVMGVALFLVAKTA